MHVDEVKWISHMPHVLGSFIEQRLVEGTWALGTIHKWRHSIFTPFSLLHAKMAVSPTNFYPASKKWVPPSAVGIWNATIWSPDFLKVGFQIVRFLNGFSYSLNHSKTGPFEIKTFLSGFRMVFDKMAAICPDFRSHSKSRPVTT